MRSVQSAEITIATAELERLWNPDQPREPRPHLLALSHPGDAGLIRVVYGSNERSVVFLARPFTLLRFDAPEYVLEADHGNVRWRIRGGLLVARRSAAAAVASWRSTCAARRTAAPTGRPSCGSRSRSRTSTRRSPPASARPVYEATQSALHVLVTHAFLRSLATLNLAKSKVGRLSRDRVRGPGRAQPDPQRRP